MNSKMIHRMVGIALLSAIVVVLQLLGQFIKLGPVSITLVLVPIVVGAAVYGPAAGGILGGVFSIVVLFQPDTLAFLNESFIGTVITVMVKGVAAGLPAGFVYNWVSKKNVWLGVLLAAFLCPIVNTAIFSLGCRLFFWDLLNSWGNGDALTFLIVGLNGFNFLAELAANMICAPAILRIIRIIKK